MQSDSLDLGPRKKFVKSLAEKLLRDAKIVSIPVSLQLIIEHLQTQHNLNVHRVNVSDKISGLLVVCKEADKESATIAFNENHPWCRRRFTIAHEIGHLLLGHTCNNRENDGTHNEREADLFAAEILIPTKLVKHDFTKGKKLDELAQFYRVSQTALTIRLLDMRLI